ncbi:zygote arrest protein 1 isoform 2-T2 [Hipposideros larvatus]
MAALGDKVLDGYMYPPWAAYSYPCSYLPAAKAKGLAGGGGWRHRRGDYPPASSSPSAAPSSFPGYGQLMAAEYFDSYQKAQLMALLSQASPGLAPRPRRAGSRDAAVQVNPRRDVSVQCSLGRRTLPRRPRDPGPPAGSGPEGAAGGSASPQPARPGPQRGGPRSGGPRPVRFPRTVAVYSPVVSRRLTAFLEGAATAAGKQRSGAPGGEPGPPPPRSRGPEQEEGSARQAPQPPPSEEEGTEARAAVRASWEPPGDGAGLPPREAREGEGAARRAPRSPEPPPPPPEGSAQDDKGDRLSPRSPEPAKERLRFQFLEQKYGYYHCKECNIRWESAYVWCVQGTNKVYFKQFCRTCQKSYNPYRVEDITCQIMLVWCLSSSHRPTGGELTLSW